MHWIRIGRMSLVKIHQMRVHSWRLLCKWVCSGYLFPTFISQAVSICVMAYWSCFFSIRLQPKATIYHATMPSQSQSHWNNTKKRTRIAFSHQGGHSESNAHGTRDSRSNASRIWGEKGWDRISTLFLRNITYIFYHIQYPYFWDMLWFLITIWRWFSIVSNRQMNNAQFYQAVTNALEPPCSWNLVGKVSVEDQFDTQRALFVAI